MSRLIVALRGFGLMFAVPLAIVGIVEVIDTVRRIGEPGAAPELAFVGIAVAALVMLNAVLLLSPRSLGPAALILGHVVLAPATAYFCFFMMVDPAAVIIAGPLVALTAVTLRPASFPVRRPAA